MADIRYVDTQSGLARVRNNTKLYVRMLDLFAKSDEFQKFEDAIQAKDNAAACDVAHALKGMSGNLSLPLVFELSTELNNQLRHGEANPETLAQYREALETTLSQVGELIQELQS